MVGRLGAREKYFLLFLFIFSFIVRLLFFSAFLKNNPMQLAFDSGHYHAVAVSLVEGKGFANPDGSPHVYRLPGYPVFLAGCYALGNRSVTVALLLQCLLASLIPLLVFGLAAVVFPTTPMVAYGASLITAIHVGFLTLAGLVMSETLFVFFFLLFLLMLCCVLRGWWRWWGLVGSGVSLGVASLIRPVGPVLVIVTILLCVLLLKPLGYAIKASIVIGSSWLLVVGLWLVRNFLLTGGLFLHTLSGPHFLNHGAARVVMMAQQCSYQDAQSRVHATLAQRINEQAALKQRQLCEWETSRVGEQIAFTTMLAHPWQTAMLCVSNMAKTVFSLYSSELLFIDSGGQLPSYTTQRGVRDMLMRFLAPTVHDTRIVWVIYCEILMHLLILVGVCGFIFLMLWRERNDLLLLLSLVAMACLLIAITCVCGFARLRLPIEPIFIMLAVRFWLFILLRKRVV